MSLSVLALPSLFLRTNSFLSITFAANIYLVLSPTPTPTPPPLSPLSSTRYMLLMLPLPRRWTKRRYTLPMSPLPMPSVAFLDIPCWIGYQHGSWEGA
ncbi:hypothetical protein CFP56_032139 [Quercus suber]|uniref:Secreted protein n=1 Tax=Quercus suber TaxID=58331 RepID=A0AAW0JHM2_QUESU